VIRRAGGARLFSPFMSYNWFIPQDGLRGELRRAERRYVALLVRQAWRIGKTPVLGCTRSLGRIWALKSLCGGTHIFLYRNLWQQWLSYLSYRRRGASYLFDTVRYVVALGAHEGRDPFLTYLCGEYADRARLLPGGDDRRPLELLSRLPDAEIFEMFVAYHVYLYLHAELTADLTVDVSRLAADTGYRSRIENEVGERTRLLVSLADARDENRTAAFEFKADAIDWATIARHADRAATTLGHLGDTQLLSRRAAQFVNETSARSQDHLN
jgi:hypothetical protein